MGKSRKNRKNKSRAVYKPRNTRDMPSVNKTMQDDLTALVRNRNIVDNARFKILMQQYEDRLMDQYNRALIRKGMPNVFDMADYDVIDISRIMADDNDAFHVQLSDDQWRDSEEYINQNQWMAFLPCFPYGILSYAPNNGVYFELRHVDAERRMMDVRVVRYATMSTELYFGDDVYATVDFGHTDNDIEPNVMLGTRTRTYMDLYTSLNAERECTWNKFDSQIWRKIVMDRRGIVNMDNHWHDMKEQVQQFVYAIALANSIIDRHSRHVQSTSTGQRITDDTAVIFDKTDYKPEMNVHVYGNLVLVRSVYRPAAPIANIKYATPSWRVRGHLRHYKNGTVTRVVPHTRTRHGLEDDGGISPRTIIRIESDDDGDDR